MKRKVVTITVILYILIISSIPEVSGAFSYDEWTPPVSRDYMSVPQSTLQHSSGKFVIAYLNRASNTMYLRIYMSSGSYEAQVSRVTTCTTSVRAVYVFEKSDTEVVVGCVGYDATIRAKVDWITVNIYSYTTSSVSSECTTGSQIWSGLSFNDAFYDDTYFYILARYHDNSIGVIPWFRYTIATSAVTNGFHNLPSGIELGHVWGFKGEGDYDGYYYMVTCKSDDDGTLRFYRITLPTMTFHLLADGANTDRVFQNQHQMYLGGGTVVSGNYVYLYHTIVSSYLDGSNYRKYFVIQHRIEFNNTSIDSSELLQQNERYTTIVPNFGVEADTSWIVGYLEEKDEIVLFGASRDGTENVCKRYDGVIGDWLSFSYTAITITEYGTVDFPFIDDEDFIARYFDTAFQYNVYDDGLKARCYTGLEPEEKTYTISTPTLTPDESPLYTDKSYLFESYILMNGAGKVTTCNILVDGVSYEIKATEANGLLDFTLIQSISGVHNVKIKVYDYGEYQAEDDWNYVYVLSDEDIPSTGTLLPVSIGAITKYLPIFLIYGSLGFGLSEIAGYVGFILGMILATFICATVGLIPTYMIYVMILGIAIALIYMVRRG